jgi:hypothetical protein
MQFCIGLVSYFKSIGFDTTDWRKNIDGSKAIVHEKFVSVLIPIVENDTNLQVLICPSTELDNLLNSPEWFKGE